MAQLSRPYQIGLLAVAVAAAAWLLLLQGHHGSPSASSSTPPPAASASAPSGSSHGSGGSAIYHGSAPGVEGLSKAIAKAHGAVGTSEQNAQQLQHKSEEASSANAPGASSTAAPAPQGTSHNAAPSSAASAPAAKSAAPTVKHTVTVKVKAPAGAGGVVLTRQHAVEAQLARGRTVLILFWDHKGADDVAVRQAVRKVGHNHRVAVEEASAAQVASFGTITRGIQVYGTPTLLIVTRNGKVRTLTGLQDAYSIEQAISEAHSA